MMNISPATKLTAVIGNPVTHSLSPLLHNAIYEKEHIDAVMLAFGHADISALVGAIRTLPIHLGAVTMPHKQSVMPFLDEIDDVAREIGAVNTVVNHGGKLTGFNTDVIGIGAALSGVNLKGANALLLGAGGAARTVAYHLRREGAHIFCHNRDIDQVKALCLTFGGTALLETEFGATPFNVIVNATPIGMAPDIDAMPVPAEIIRPGAAIFDLVYSPLETRFLKTARERGAQAISGIVMFLAQGIAQERIWLAREVAESGYGALLSDALQKH